LIFYLVSLLDFLIKSVWKKQSVDWRNPNP
jgi:hypothetical protein